MVLFLDSGLPNGVLDSIKTECLWEKFLVEYGESAWVRWIAMYREMEKEVQNEITEKSDCRF